MSLISVIDDLYRESTTVHLSVAEVNTLDLAAPGLNTAERSDWSKQQTTTEVVEKSGGFEKLLSNVDSQFYEIHEVEMAKQSIRSWFHTNFYRDDNQRLLVDEVYNAFKTHFGTGDKKTVGRYVSSAFPNVYRTKQRQFQNWTKYDYLYQGIGKRTSETCQHLDSQSNLSCISTDLPEGFFVIDKNATFMTIGRFTSIYCNGNRVTIEISISASGKVEISMGGKNITEQCFVTPQITLNTLSISTLLTSITSLRYCQGVMIDEVPSMFKENAVFQKNYSNDVVAYANTCKKIIDFNSHKSVHACRSCRSLLHKVDSVTGPITSHRHMSPSDAPAAPSDTPAAPSDTPAAPSDTPATPSDTPAAPSDTPAAPSDIESKDIISFLRAKAPFLTECQLSFYSTQLDNSNIGDVHGRRWDNATIQLCLPLWTRSPRTYEELAANGSLVLPSVSTLQRHKNAVAQEAGINKDVFKWMYMEAISQNLPKEGFYGGLILDEMSIQEDLQIVKKGGQVKLVGLTESNTSAGDTTLANHVLQYVFHGFTGFRFPVSHFPTKQANAPQLYSSFWEIVQSLQEWGFHVVYSSVDGASTNRSFIKMHFEGSPTMYDMAAPNPFDSLPVVFIADPSHLFKKIRNNILKSGPQKWHSRNLSVEGNPIVWKMWIDCYEWDKLHGLSIHQKLTNEHLHPNKAELMRNHLAEDVLDDNMLNLMLAYKKHLGNSKALDGAIAVLRHTSRMIHIFHDRRPIKDVCDERLRHLQSTMKWFKVWEGTSTKSQLMSWETMEDVQFLTTGFCKLVHVALTEFHITVTPMFINSDIVENHFSQQRGLYHGSGANPNYYQYRTANNSIILGQSTISKKSNATRGMISKSHGALPFRQLCKKLRM